MVVRDRIPSEPPVRGSGRLAGYWTLVKRLFASKRSLFIGVSGLVVVLLVVLSIGLRYALAGSPSTTTTTTSVPASPSFMWSVSPIDGSLEQALVANGLWFRGAPVSLDQLSDLTVSYWDFDGNVQSGDIVVNNAWVSRIATVFQTLFQAHFPIRRMDSTEPAHDTGSLVATDNTRAFQARRVNGVWSMHSYGLAIDINPGENPWVEGRSVIPSAGAEFVNRSLDVPGLITKDSIVIQAFAAIGWKWGGNWKTSKDYMHFSSNGH